MDLRFAQASFTLSDVINLQLKKDFSEQQDERIQLGGLHSTECDQCSFWILKKQGGQKRNKELSLRNKEFSFRKKGEVFICLKDYYFGKSAFIAFITMTNM